MPRLFIFLHFLFASLKEYLAGRASEKNFTTGYEGRYRPLASGASSKLV